MEYGKKEKKKTKDSLFINITNILKIILQSSSTTFVLLLFCNVAVGIMVPVSIYLWKGFIDGSAGAIAHGGLRLPILFLAAMCGVRILSDLLDKINNYLQRMLQEYMNKYVSNIIMEKVSVLDLTFFDAADTYDLIERVNQDSISRCISMLNLIITLIRNITSLFGTASIIIVFNPLIGILCFAATIPIFSASITISREQYLIFIKRIQSLRYVDCLKDLSIQYNNIKELKLFRAIPFLRGIMNETYDKYLKEDKVIRKKYICRLTGTGALQTVMSYGLRIFILLSVVKKQMTIGDLTMYIQAMENLELSIRTVMDTVASLYADNLYIENLIRLIETKSEQEKGEMVFSGEFQVIEFKNVSFKYPSAEEFSLKNINLCIEHKNAYALVGENGSGKTTLIKLLMRLYDPTDGAIYVDGINLKQFTRDSIYSNIGVIFQDYIKYPLDVQSNIGIGYLEEMNNLQKIRSASEKSKADAFIKFLPKQYHTFLNKEWDQGVELSIGQWQKIAISRAYFNEEASLLILDEPSASLDPKAEYEMFHDFKQMTPNKTSILITHRFSNVKLADKIFVIQDGSLIEEGTHDQLLSNGLVYKELYNMQAEAYKS